jgi:DNA processing protein
MENRIKSAVILSILSSPSKFGLWNRLNDLPEDILSSVPAPLLITSEVMNKKYSDDPIVSADLIIQRCEDTGIKIITLWDEDYPALLKEIDHPPLVLYIKGALNPNKMISIVGTRNSDKRSEFITKRISEDISKAGYTIVSGMALGIDRCAHLGALKAGGSTIAVLPSAVDIIYPVKNNDIYRMIYESKDSAIISEYPPGIGVYEKWAFVKRNRIISGLSEQVIIVQAPLKSGAMITAKYAIDQNRELFACPGNAFDDKYSGCHELIKQGARLFSSMNDLFSESVYDGYSQELFETEEVKQHKESVKEKIAPEKKLNDFKNPIEQKIMEDLKKGNVEIDKFIRQNNFPVDEVNEAVTLLEISGYITRRGNILYDV